MILVIIITFITIVALWGYKLKTNVNFANSTLKVKPITTGTEDAGGFLFDDYYNVNIGTSNR